MSRDVVFEGGTAEALTAAAYCARAGGRPVVVDGGVRVGQELATESFLSPFRFDLGVGHFLRWGNGIPDVPGELELPALGLELRAPEVPLAVTRAGRPPFRLHRSWSRTLEAVPAEADAVERLLADGRRAARLLAGHDDAAADETLARLGAATAADALDRHGVRDADLRCALTYLPLAFGIAPDRPGGGLTTALLAASLDRFTVVWPGTGALGAALGDRIVGHGGALVEGRDAAAAAPASAAHVVRAPDAPAGGPALSRLFLGVGGEAPRRAGHVTVFGVESEQAILDRLEGLRAGRPLAPAGHFTARRDDGDPMGRPLRSIVCHLLVDGAGARSREALAADCAAALGAGEPLFRILWLPEETGAVLAEIDWQSVRTEGAAAPSALRAGPRSVLAALTGLATGRWLFDSLPSSDDRSPDSRRRG